MLGAGELESLILPFTFHGSLFTSNDLNPRLRSEHPYPVHRYITGAKRVLEGIRLFRRYGDEQPPGGLRVEKRPQPVFGLRGECDLSLKVIAVPIRPGRDHARINHFLDPCHLRDGVHVQDSSQAGSSAHLPQVPEETEPGDVCGR